MRRDAYVENDSGGMSLLASAVVERVIDDGRENDAEFVKNQEVVLGSLVGDDSFIARVVVGEPLTADESGQWITRYRTALVVPCGKLLVCGGFDPGELGDWVEEGECASVQVFEVPKGHYLVDVYTYLHSMNGLMIASEEWGEKVGAWFRRDHPGRAFPSWLASELSVMRDDDPGHEEKWADLPAAIRSGALAIETQPLDWVSFLIHLQPFDASAALCAPEEGEWFGAGQGMRKPTVFPLGVPARGARDPECHDALESLLDEGE
jgi:hypothetical protein